MNIEYYIYGAVIITLTLLIWHKLRLASMNELEKNIIGGMKQVAESMKAGNSFEAAIKSVSDKSKILLENSLRKF